MKKLLSLLLLVSTLLATPAWSGTVVLATDDFNRADNADLGTNWTPNLDSMKIQTNTARANNGSLDDSERYSGISWPADQYSKVALSTVNTNPLGTGMGVTCRMDTGGANTMYRLVGASTGYELGRINTGTFTSITSSSGTTFANGDTIKLTCTGSATVTMQMFKNDVQFGSTQTDSSGSRLTSGAAGLANSSSISGGTAVDNWEGGAIVGGARKPIVFQ